MYTSSKVNDDAWRGLTFSLRDMVHRNFAITATDEQKREKQRVSTTEKNCTFGVSCFYSLLIFIMIRLMKSGGE